MLSACGSRETEENRQLPVTLAVNAYSFNDLLMARSPRNDEQVYTLFNLVDWCADRGIKALDPTAYYFPGYPEVPPDEYLERFCAYAATRNVTLSGTGIRNNFASPDPEVRADGIRLAKEWIVAASKMGIPMVRLFAGEIPEGYEDRWEEVAGWMIECFKECADFGKEHGVKIGIQNHGDMLSTATQCAYVLDAVDSEWAGLMLDIGSFRTENPWEDIAAMVPYAISWQVKESVFGTGSGERTDFLRLVRIIKEGGYRGFLPIESLMVNGQSYDPFDRVKTMISEMQEAIDKVYGGE